MCNLYSLNKGQDHIRREFKVNWDDTGNMPPLPGIFPDMTAPVVRNDGDGRRMQMMRWGMPPPPKFLTAGAIDRGVTNIRNVESAHWRSWLKPEFRCLVPATSFSETTDKPNATGKKDWIWFALSEERPLFAFAGIWCTWHGVLRGSASLRHLREVLPVCINSRSTIFSRITGASLRAGRICRLYLPRRADRR